MKSESVSIYKKIEILSMIFLDSVVYYIVNAEKRKSNIHVNTSL